MADKAFGVKQLNILGSGTPSIESPSDLNLNANKVAISTNLTVGGASTFTGNISANGNIIGDSATNISGINSVTATTYFGDGSSLTGVGGTGVLEEAGINTSGTSTFTNLNVTGVSTFGGVTKFNQAVDITGSNDLTFGNGNNSLYKSGDDIKWDIYGDSNLELRVNAGGGTDGDIILKTLFTEALKINGTGDIIVGSGMSVVGVSTFAGNINANGNIIGDNATNISGINSVTATTLSGDSLMVGAASTPTGNGTFYPAIQQIGTDSASSSLNIFRFSNDAYAANIRITKSRSTDPSSLGIVQQGDEIGNIYFLGDDGDNLNSGAARILAKVTGTPQSGAGMHMPLSLSFWTAPDGGGTAQERLTVYHDGNVGINRTVPTEKLDVDGTVKATSFDGSLASGNVATSANSIILGRVSGGAGSVEELTPTQIRTLLNVADGATAGSGIANIVEDGTPELGGFLDLNSKGIFGVGVITATSFVGSGASLTALPALANSKSVVNPGYPQNQTFTVWLAARYNTNWEHYVVDNGNFGSGVSADRTGNISGNDATININVGDTLILDLATQATLNNAAGPTSIKTAAGTGSANRVGVSPDTNPVATNNGSSSTNITWSPTVAGTYYYQNESRVNMVGQIIVSPQASPPASKFISDINFNSEGRVVGVVTFNGINAATKNTRGIVQIHNDPNLSINAGIVSITQSLNLTGVVTAASFSGSGIGLTSLPADELTGQLPVINASNLTNLSSSQLTGALPAISGAALTGIQYTGITTINGQLFLNGMSKETINIVANKLSAATNIDLEDGLVHYFSTTETADATPNIRFNSSTTLNSKLSVGDSITVTIISSTDNTNYSYEQLTIDGSAVTEQWIGGAAPSGGSSGYDIYTFQIIKTADATYLVFGNKVNFT